MAEKVTVTLLKPLDGKDVGEKAEYDRADVQGLVDMGAVKATGFTASAPAATGIISAADDAKAAPESKDLVSAPRNKSRKG